MIVDFTVYDAAGTVVRTGSAMSETQANAQAINAGEYVVLTKVDYGTQVIDPPNSGTNPTPAPVVIARPNAPMSIDKTNFLANGTDFVTISNVPVGAVYGVQPPSSKGIEQALVGIVTEGVLEITTTVAGAYIVTINSYPNKDYVVTINAT